MTEPTTDTTTEVPSVQEIRTSRDAENWAKAVSTLSVGDLPPEAINRNVQGRKVMSPLQGFGKMWQKTYKVSIPASVATPQEVIATWKANFPKFWPPKNFFYGPLTGIAPGEVAVLNLSMPGRLKLSTGVLVLYADEESFTLMSPQGHMFAGWITFSSFELDDQSVIQVQVLVRADDPIYELGLALGGHRKEDRFWFETLTNVGAHFEVEGVQVDTLAVCVDKKRQWRNAKNVWHNSAIRSGLYALGAPFRAVARPFKKKEVGGPNGI
ncbi:MAG: hypothetical protein ABR579_10595 [Actinomycetota bacterium]